MSVEKETHVILLWCNNIFIKEEVTHILQDTFSIRRVFNIQWDKNLYDKNLKILYAPFYKHLSKEEFSENIIGKKKLNANDLFYVIVFDHVQSLNKKYLLTEKIEAIKSCPATITDLAELEQKVNSVIKEEHSTYITQNSTDSNKILTLLFGKNLNDFISNFPGKDTNEIIWSKNCLGVGGYTHITELFYVLNNTISYVVMRNFEPLPNSYTLEGHGDIDLLVEDLDYMVYLTDAQSIFPDFDYRVHYQISIDGEMIPFDFRFLGDDYYDLKWQKHMLETKTIYKEMIHVPNAQNYFYSLMYHAYIHKNSIREDYQLRLQIMGKNLGVKFNENTSPISAIKVLDEFMRLNNYEYTIPLDESVFYNKLLLQETHNPIIEYGKRINRSQCRFENQSFISQVFEKDNIITKVASAVIIKNEIEYLKRLSGYEFFPKVLYSKITGEYGIIQTEKIEGESIQKLIKKRHFWKKKNLIHIFSDALEVLKILVEKDIQHRDIRPNNIILVPEKDYYRLRLIDFGWAANLSESKNVITPRSLGSKYKYNYHEFSDAYSMGQTINFNYLALSFYHEVYKALISITPNDYEDPKRIVKKINKIQKLLIPRRMTLLENIKLFYYQSRFLVDSRKIIFERFKRMLLRRI